MTISIRLITILSMFMAVLAPAYAQDSTSSTPPIQDVLVRMLGEAQLTIARDEAQEKILSDQLRQAEAEIAALQAQQRHPKDEGRPASKGGPRP